jgi:hypothetical protein
MVNSVRLISYGWRVKQFFGNLWEGISYEESNLKHISCNIIINHYSDKYGFCCQTLLHRHNKGIA